MGGQGGPGASSSSGADERIIKRLCMAGGTTAGMSITHNPLDILAGRIYAPDDTADSREKPPASPVSSAVDDTLLMSALLKQSESPPAGGDARGVPHRSGIFRRLVLFSSAEMAVPVRKYFKFPFESGIRNDGSRLFSQLHGLFVQSMYSVFSNYRKFREPFKVLMAGEIILFDKLIRVPKALRRTLVQNDISFDDDGECLVVPEGDAPLVYDVLLNTEITKGSVLPFIFSEYEFDNAIVYHTRVERGAIVRVGADREYMYTVHGQLYSDDYLVEGVTSIKYVE